MRTTSRLIATLLLYSFLLNPTKCIAIDNEAGNSLKVVYFTTGSWGPIFDRKAKERMRQGGYDLEPMYMLWQTARNAGYDLRLIDRDATTLTEEGGSAEDFVCFIAFDVYGNQLRYLKNCPKEKLALFLWEPPSVTMSNYETQYHQLFSRVYTWDDDLVDGKTYYKLHYPALHPMQPNPIPFSKRKFAVLVASNRHSSHPDELYSKRGQVVRFYEKRHPKELDLYGRNWKNSSKTYRGLADNKFQVLQEHRFCYCYENMKGIKGYVSEKIFDCFEAGCVPIYWGASNIYEYIPKGCFIDRGEFANEQQLYDFLSKMSRADHEAYLKNIRNYLASEEAQQFSAAHFVDTVMELIESCDSN